MLLQLAPLTLHAQEEDEPATEDKPKLKIGGALRFNYNLSTWKEGQKKRGGDFGYDIFRVNVQGEHKGVKINAEYRLYSQAFGGGVLKQGWLGYDLNAQDNIQLGLTQVPFGNTQYNSHNWFFSINYYLGLEDDHDMGVKFTHKGEQWEYSLGYFANAEELVFGNNSDISNSRYSYDVASIDLTGDGNLELRNKEVNQFNGKLSYVSSQDHETHKLGVSGQIGGLYNLDTEEMGHHYALAIHYEYVRKQFDAKLQVTHYAHRAKNPSGQRRDIMGLTAYGFPYTIASEATTFTAGVAYAIPVDWRPISNLQVYNDFGAMIKRASSFEPSLMNVTGVLITAGQLYTYLDFAAGKDQPWLGPVWTSALAEGTPGASWEMRFNINFGYYF